jgi:hypothetical protein
MPSRSLDGLRFRSARDVEGGDVGADTIFHYREDDGVVHARYEGGAVTLGFLVGSRSGDRLDFRYAQLRADGTTATGHCVSEIETLADGRLRMNETWEWDSADGSGTSILEQVS